MNDTRTITKPPVGQQVRIASMPGNRWIGAIGTVSDAYEPLTQAQISVTVEGTTMPTQNDCWLIDGWEIVYPNVGDKVIPLPHNNNWYGIPDAYHNAVGTVTSVSGSADISGYRYVSAEFQSHQKPDDTINWSFYCWKPADGHTLTVSDPYRPAVGDKVTITGYLDHDGIHDGINRLGSIIKVDDDIYTVLVDEREYVSGPGYVALFVDPYADDAPALPHEEPRIITELRDEAAVIKRELDRANERVEEFRTRAGKWERDFMRYAERIVQEANERDWCSEYDLIMGEISGELEIATIPERDVEVDIEWEETYTVTVKRTGTVTLLAGYNESDVENAARDLNGNDDADRSEILDAVREGEYESCEFVDGSAEVS